MRTPATVRSLPRSKTIEPGLLASCRHINFESVGSLAPIYTVGTGPNGTNIVQFVDAGNNTDFMNMTAAMDAACEAGDLLGVNQQGYRCVRQIAVGRGSAHASRQGVVGCTGIVQ